ASRFVVRDLSLLRASHLSFRLGAPPRSPLFPYTTLFRSVLLSGAEQAGDGGSQRAEFVPPGAVPRRSPHGRPEVEAPLDCAPDRGPQRSERAGIEVRRVLEHRELRPIVRPRFHPLLAVGLN